MIAALYVQTGGCYFGLPDVDPWDEQRDARLYAGPWPVVAHPPCARWCRLAGLVEKRWGHKIGDDGGCFAAALASVRRWVGVLEHPAYSDAWPAFGLPEPVRHGGWHSSLFDDGWSCHVEQHRYCHRAKKATWLYAVKCNLPELKFGSIADQDTKVCVSWCGNKTRRGGVVERMGKRERSASPVEFRDILISMAQSVPQ